MKLVNWDSLFARLLVFQRQTEMLLRSHCGLLEDGEGSGVGMEVELGGILLS